MKNNNAKNFLPTLIQLVKIVCLLAAVYFVAKCVEAQDDGDVDIKPTPIVIESIKPIGELYAFTAITEDFTIDNVEKVGFFTRKFYKAVQTMRMQVSYVMSLDSVTYQQIAATDTVVVTLPSLRYIQTAQEGRLLCEVEVSNYDAVHAINIVEEKIRSKYDTPANRRQALAHVHEVLTAFVQQCGLIPKFIDKP